MRAERASAVAALRHRQFQLLFAGLVGANLGIWMQQFAIGWLIAEIAVRDGDPGLAALYLGIRSLASALPALALGLFAGVWADRMDRRRLLMTARVASAVVAMVLAGAALTGQATIAVVVLLGAASSAAFAVDPPGRQALLPNVVPPDALFSAVGLARISMQAAHTFGPLIAGLLVPPIGVGGVLLVKAGLDLTSLVALKLMREHPVAPDPGRLGIRGSLKEGLAYIHADRLLYWCAILQLTFSLLLLSFVQMLPAFAVDALHVGALELSWMVAAVGVGALLGAVLVASSGGVERRGILMLGAMFLTGTFTAVLGLQRDLVGVLLSLAALGLLQQVFMGTQSIILQLAAPDRLRGRVMATQSVIFMSAGPVGVFALGLLSTAIGIASAFLFSGLAVMAITTVAIARVHVIRDLRASADLGRLSGADVDPSVSAAE